MVALPSGLEDAFGYEGLGLGCRVWACSGFRISTLNFGLLTVVPVLQVEEGAKKALKPKA